MIMKLYYAPGACPMGIHLLLEEIGKPFELEKIDLMTGAQLKPEFVAINPKSKVPVLQLDDGSTVTEFPAIAFYLARANPEAGLLPTGLRAETKALELLDYLIATMHMRGFTRINRPGAFTPNEADFDKVRETGIEFVKKGFALLEPELGDKAYILGEFSIVESALFFLEHWTRNRIKVAMPANFEAHLDRLLARPAARRVLEAEGLA
jgi:glutathione S-transferase